MSILTARFLLVISMSTLIACKPTDQRASDGMAQDRSVFASQAISPPTDADNAKIHISPNEVTLAKAHVIPIKSERYQPAFRLEGVITPHKQDTVILPKDGKIDHLLVKSGDMVQKGDTLAQFYQETLIMPPPDDKSTSDDTHDTNNEVIDEHDNDDTPIIIQEFFEVHATMTGKVGAIFIPNTQDVHNKDSPILVLFDDQFIKFISPLPANFSGFLSVGNVVNFSTEDGRGFSGQIARIMPSPASESMMEIHVAISPKEATKAKLTLGERVGGYVEYGQIDMGVLLPSFAIFDDLMNVMDLSHLLNSPHKPTTPLPAWVWSIGQDGKLALSQVFVVEYLPAYNQYLVAGISPNGLMVLANLPKSADGKKVHLK